MRPASVRWHRHGGLITSSKTGHDEITTGKLSTADELTSGYATKGTVVIGGSWTNEFFLFCIKRAARRDVICHGRPFAAWH